MALNLANPLHPPRSSNEMSRPKRKHEVLPKSTKPTNSNQPQPAQTNCQPTNQAANDDEQKPTPTNQPNNNQHRPRPGARHHCHTAHPQQPQPRTRGRGAQARRASRPKGATPPRDRRLRTRRPRTRTTSSAGSVRPVALGLKWRARLQATSPRDGPTARTPARPSTRTCRLTWTVCRAGRELGRPEGQRSSRRCAPLGHARNQPTEISKSRSMDKK